MAQPMRKTKFEEGKGKVAAPVGDMAQPMRKTKFEEGKGKVAAPVGDMAQPSTRGTCRRLFIAAYTGGIATALEKACLAMTAGSLVLASPG
jgi:hypothetical protein